MPQLFLAALIGAGAYAGYRVVRHLRAQGAARAHSAEVVESREPRNLGSLRRDPDTGFYRPG